MNTAPFHWFRGCFFVSLSKTWRLNKLMNSGLGMKRIKVEAKDVMLPFLILLLINVVLILCMTFVTPSRYQRIDQESYDMYGRSLASFGTCQPENTGTFNKFLIPLLVCDFIGVLVATYQSWMARKLPTEFSESKYLALSMMSLLETLILGGPILLVVSNNPTASYLVSSALIWVACMTILLPLFLPKYHAFHNNKAAGASLNQSNKSKKNIV
jgi:hypothetical protein